MVNNGCILSLPLRRPQTFRFKRWVGGTDSAPAPTNELEEAEQLVEALRRSLRVSSPSSAPASPEPEPSPASESGAPAGGVPATATDRLPACAASEPCSPAVSRPLSVAGDIRFYAVWVVPRRPYLRGVWHGPHPLCWERLSAQLPGGRPVGGVRLRRADTLEEALDLYASEAVRHGAPLPPPLHPVP